MCIYDVYGPFSCPHGRCFTVLAQFFAIASWITSVVALTSCFYVSVRPIPGDGEVEMPKEGFGWISRQIEVMEPPAYGKQCAWYTSEERALYFDGMWNAGFAMAVVSVLLGLVVVSIVLCTCCVAFQIETFDGLFWTCAICFVAQALTFLSWGSTLCEEMECTWSSGTGMNLTAAMMWIWAANMIKSFPEALPPRTRESRHDDYEEDDEDDDGRGDVYLSNPDAAPNDNEYGDWDQDKGDGYYDDDGNWVVHDNSYSENEKQYDSYDDYDGDEGSRRNKNKQQFEKDTNHSESESQGQSRGAYSDYDNDSNSNWAEGSDADDFDETAPLGAPPTQEQKQKRIPKKKKKKGGDEMEDASSLGSYDNDDWDDERNSFKYT